MNYRQKEWIKHSWYLEGIRDCFQDAIDNKEEKDYILTCIRIKEVNWYCCLINRFNIEINYWEKNLKYIIKKEFPIYIGLIDKYQLLQ